MDSALRYNNTASINMKPQKPMVVQEKEHHETHAAFGQPVAVARDSLKCSELSSKSHTSEQATVSDVLPIPFVPHHPILGFCQWANPSAMRICQARYKDPNE